MKRKNSRLYLYILLIFSIFSVTITSKVFSQQEEKKEITTEKNSDQNRLTLTAVGDVMHSYFTAHTKKFDALGADKYKPTKHLIENADLAFANLETPYTNKPPVIKKVFSYATKPAELKHVLNTGFNLFSLSNNHSADAGFSGLKDTLYYLNKFSKELYAKGHKKEIIWAGTGLSHKKARKYKIFKVKNKNFKVAFLAYGNNRSPYVNRFNIKNAIKDIKSAKSQNVDLIIASVHTGDEYVHRPKSSKVRDFRKMISAGANIILGHHPHVVQGIENYKNGIIFYSLGNYSFGSMTRRHLKKKALLYGMIAQIEIIKNDSGMDLKSKIHPMYVDNTYPMKVGKKKLKIRSFQPVIPEDPFASKILKSIKKWSSQIPGNKTMLEMKDKKIIINTRIKN